MLQKALKTATVVATALLVACGGNDAPVSASAQPSDVSVPVINPPDVGSEPTAEQPVGETPTLQAQYEALVEQANAAQAEVLANAEAGPCTQDEQCVVLTLESYAAPCFDKTQYLYSTQSPKAASVAAEAERYAAAASAAVLVAPPLPPGFIPSCSNMVDSSPAMCSAGTCQRGFRFDVATVN